MIILRIIVTVILVFIMIGVISQAGYFKPRREKIRPYGQMVDVDDGQMHVYSMGQGEKKVILLPGMGIPFPSVDFGPLMRKLSEEYTAVCVEYFGVGLSSETAKARTTDNYVEEIRTALKQAGFKAPYVLMPHSISSVYAEHYAAKYPDEVEALISLDGTSSAHYEAIPGFVKHVLKAAKIQQALGMSSILSHLPVNQKALRSKGYTESEISDASSMAGFNINNTLLEQIANSAEFVRQTMDEPFPQSVPFFKIISKDTYEKKNSQLKMSPQEYQHQHLERIGKHAQFEILEGNHFIYHNNEEKIFNITKKLLSRTDG